MERLMSKNILKAFLFGIYEVVMLFVFDVFSLFKFDFSLFFLYSFSFLLIVGFNVFLNSLFAKNTFLKSYVFFNYLTSSFLCGVFVSIVVGDSLNIYLVLISSFVIPSFLPTLFVFLSSLFLGSKSESKVKEEGKVKESLANQNEKEIVQDQLIEETNIDFVLTNENGKVLLDVKTNKIICFEANDNYAVTYYLNDKDEVKKSMERISLKKIEDILKRISASSFERVHKSYLINTKYVEEVTGKAQAYKLEMSRLQFKIPVSRSFKISVLK
jgi:hypothetical protein